MLINVLFIINLFIFPLLHANAIVISVKTDKQNRRRKKKKLPRYVVVCEL